MLSENMSVIQQSLNRSRGMARELKRRCNLTESAEFFDAACHGPAAADWYRRSNERLFNAAQLFLAAEDNVRDSLSIAEESALADKLAQNFRVIAAEQDSDPPPPAFGFLHQLHLDYFRTNADMFSQAMTADEATWQTFEITYEDIVLTMRREKARLDFSCASEVPDLIGTYVPPYYQTPVTGAPEPLQDRILSACATSPLYAAGTIVTTQSEGYLLVPEGYDLLVPVGTQLGITGPLIERGPCDEWPVGVIWSPADDAGYYDYPPDTARGGDTGIISEAVFQANADLFMPTN